MYKVSSSTKNIIHSFYRILHLLHFFRCPVVAVGIVKWVEFTVTEPSYFKLCTEHTPIHLALLDEVVTCHPLLHMKVLTLLVELFESKQDELEILVQVLFVALFKDS